MVLDAQLAVRGLPDVEVIVGPGHRSAVMYIRQRGLGYIREGEQPVVPQQAVRPGVREEKIEIPIIVVVARHRTVTGQSIDEISGSDIQR